MANARVDFDTYVERSRKGSNPCTSVKFDLAWDSIASHKGWVLLDLRSTISDVLISVGRYTSQRHLEEMLAAIQQSKTVRALRIEGLEFLSESNASKVVAAIHDNPIIQHFSAIYKDQMSNKHDRDANHDLLFVLSSIVYKKDLVSFSLEGFNFYNRDSKQTENFFKIVAANEKLKTLTLAGCRMNAREFKELTASPHLTRINFYLSELERWIFSRPIHRDYSSGWDYYCDNTLKALGASNATHLDVRGMDITKGEFSSFVDGLYSFDKKMPNQSRTILLPDMGDSIELAQRFRDYLVKTTTLTTLEIWDNERFTPVDTEYCSRLMYDGIARNKSLKALSLANKAYFSPYAMRGLCQALPKNTSLNVVEIPSCFFIQASDALFKNFVQALEQNKSIVNLHSNWKKVKEIHPERVTRLIQLLEGTKAERDRAAKLSTAMMTELMTASPGKTDEKASFVVDKGMNSAVVEAADEKAPFRKPKEEKVDDSKHVVTEGNRVRFA